MCIRIQETTTLANTTCTAVPYMNNESVCYSFLLQYKSCNSAVNGSNDVFISSNVNVQESENIASELKILQNLLSPQCRAVSLPFICLYLFPLCGENGTVYLPSSEQCNSISTDICKGEWVMAQEVISSLPNCALLPNVSSCNCRLFNEAFICLLLFIEVLHSSRTDCKFFKLPCCAEDQLQ